MPGGVEVSLTVTPLSWLPRLPLVLELKCKMSTWSMLPGLCGDSGPPFPHALPSQSSSPLPALESKLFSNLLELLSDVDICAHPSSGSSSELSGDGDPWEKPALEPLSKTKPTLMQLLPSMLDQLELTMLSQLLRS